MLQHERTDKLVIVTIEFDHVYPACSRWIHPRQKTLSKARTIIILYDMYAVDREEQGVLSRK
jgi:hypothetical protein